MPRLPLGCWLVIAPFAVVIGVAYGIIWVLVQLAFLAVGLIADRRARR